MPNAPRRGGALLRPYRSTQYTPTGAGTLRPKQDRGKPAHSALSAYRRFRPSVKNARRRWKTSAPGVFHVLPLRETSPWRDRCFHLWEKTWKFILDKRDDCIFYLRYYSSPDFYAYEHDRQQQYYHALIHRVAYLFRPETDLDMLMHQVFETMLAFAAHVMAGDMENNDLTTERTFEQIYSFIAPHFRAELTEGAGKETAVL